MNTRLLPLALLGLAACSGEVSENSARCGFTHQASAVRVLDQSSNSIRALNAWPEGVSGMVPARVVGYGTGQAIVGETEDGIMAGFEGAGFPATPGYGIAIVDDSSEVFRGILIFDREVPNHLPQLGAVAGERLVIPMYALRIHWSSVNDSTCPMFSTPETGTTSD